MVSYQWLQCVFYDDIKRLLGKLFIYFVTVNVRWCERVIG